MANYINASPSRPHLRRRLLQGLVALGVFAIVSVFTFEPTLLDGLAWLVNPENLSRTIEIVGPLAVVLLLALAVVVSPIPSGPVAMAAGAFLGPFEGGAYTAIGAVLGASIAFGLSRCFGYRPLSNCSFPLAQWVTCPRTQLKLALVVFVSRLIPFISFDAVSYAAGLTTITPRNFILATTFGVLPASFAFSALGAGMATYDSTALLIAASSVTLIVPALFVVFRQFRTS